MKSYDNFTKALADNQERMTKLNQEIESMQLEVDQLGKDYNKCVIQGDDEQADKTFNLMESRQSGIRNNQNKLEVLKENDIAKAEAEKVLYEGLKENKKLQDKAEKKFQEVEAIKHKLYQKLQEIGQIEQENETIQNQVEHASEFTSMRAIDYKDGIGVFYIDSGLDIQTLNMAKGGFLDE